MSSTHQDIDTQEQLLDSHKNEKLNNLTESLDEGSQIKISPAQHESIEPDFYDDLMIDNNVFG